MKVPIKNIEFPESKTDGICHCPKNEQLIVYNWKGKRIKSGYCKRCSGLIDTQKMKGGLKTKDNEQKRKD